MENNLVIVESPAKAKTIKKFLGDDFLVMSSYGHIRDLSKKNLGVNVDKDFEPEYEIPVDKKKIVTELKKIASQVKTVWLASDEDREGEAISWHLSEVLKLKEDNYKRIVFHEITQTAIQNAIENPRGIDFNLVNAQQARRVLDRIVGFSLSPLLWKKIKPSLSAGRVQSVAVKLVVEREREITAFKTKSEYKVFGFFNINGAIVRAELNKKFKTNKEAREFLETMKGVGFSVSDVIKKPGKKSPAPPFTTSTLQQEAGRKLGMSVTQTMKFAQGLYENGHITYMRTDSVNLSGLAINSIKKAVIDKFGEEYSKVRQYSTKSKGAQEAHEAIRPTYVENDLTQLGKQEQRLYDLIWKRAVASQMADAVIERTIIVINGNNNSNYEFTATGEIVSFDGFLKLYIESSDDEATDEKQSVLPNVTKNTPAIVDRIEATEKYDQPPFRFTEASLVKKMEELGIGRPSTYAPTISTIQQRDYVVKESRPPKTRKIGQFIYKDDDITENILTDKFGGESNKLFPTSMGVVVTDYLCGHFEEILDYNFTAQIEQKFDEIAEGKLVWNDMIKSFYGSFNAKVDASLKEKENTKWEREIGLHPELGLPIVLKIGKYGPYASVEGTEKPKYAGLRKNQNIESITLEEVLDLFKLPRTLGDYLDDEVVVALGKYGPYVRNNTAFYALKKTDDPYEITLERAIEIIVEKKESVKEAFSRTFEEIPNLKILKGRYGPYISFEKKNYRIPKAFDPETITAEECKSIIGKKNSKTGK
ncbi:MAG: type I DNA topoisomerase [Bacteroidales bacterium]|nr:type I DNA topoisomerase [Bacteroidales bacterium]MDD4216561.1 type I DNA topoisomerase [Bacteroidales bacterium]MDY0141362.1 type I DNA topoisomerase [Bacteroidales bacterium]